jgi:preprotein translocase subunit Sss1
MLALNLVTTMGCTIVGVVGVLLLVPMSTYTKLGYSY